MFTEISPNLFDHHKWTVGYPAVLLNQLFLQGRVLHIYEIYLNKIVFNFLCLTAHPEKVPDNLTQLSNNFLLKSLIFQGETMFLYQLRGG